MRHTLQQNSWTYCDFSWVV